MNKLRIWVLTVIGILVAYQPVAADKLHLTNGDVISGKLVRMVDKKLVFKTEYAGEITVDWESVLKLINDEPIKVVLSDGTVLEGAMQETDENKMALDVGKLEKPAKFELKEVAAINPVPKPPVRITARANVGIESERGNSDTDDAHFDAELTARTDRSRYRFGGEFNQKKDDGRDTSKNWLAYGKYAYLIRGKWFLYANTIFEHDKFKDLDLRTTLGTGLGYQFFESDEVNLLMAAGPAYVNENFIDAGDNDFGAGQWLINYDQYFFNERVQLFHNQRGYVSTSDTNNRLVNTRQGLRFPLYKGLTATIQYNYDYDNEPSEDADRKWDSTLLFLLGWQFKNWDGKSARPATSP